MRLSFQQRIKRKVNRLLGQHEDSFLKSVSGVVHVGGNLGQERDDYARHGIDVLWIEPIPAVFNQLEINIAGCHTQTALQALVTDTVGKSYTFNIASNDGASSSILPPGKHKELWPEVTFEQQLSITSTTLDQLLADGTINPSVFDALIMDTQGSELLVLEGGGALLKHINFIKTEAADFESYEGCCTRNDLDQHLTQQGFELLFEEPFAHGEGVGSYFTLVYGRSEMPSAN